MRLLWSKILKVFGLNAKCRLSDSSLTHGDVQTNCRLTLKVCKIEVFYEHNGICSIIRNSQSQKQVNNTQGKMSIDLVHQNCLFYVSYCLLSSYFSLLLLKRYLYIIIHRYWNLLICFVFSANHDGLTLHCAQ